jgi:hypothetical protein
LRAAAFIAIIVMGFFASLGRPVDASNPAVPVSGISVGDRNAAMDSAKNLG